MSFCLAGAGVAVHVAASSFSLSWTHTIEKTEWRETWRVEGDRLVLAEARIKGSGAGMEPPPEARLVGGAYVWEPNIALRSIVLRRNPGAGDWTLCANNRCDKLGDWLERDVEPVTLSAGTDRTCAELSPN